MLDYIYIYIYVDDIWDFDVLCVPSPGLWRLRPLSVSSKTCPAGPLPGPKLSTLKPCTVKGRV